MWQKEPAKHNGRGRVGRGQALRPRGLRSARRAHRQRCGPRVSNPRHLSSLETGSLWHHGESVWGRSQAQEQGTSLREVSRRRCVALGLRPHAEGIGQGWAEPSGRGGRSVPTSASGRPGDTQPRPGVPPSRTRPRAAPGGPSPEPTPIPPLLPVARPRRSLACYPRTARESAGRPLPLLEATTSSVLTQGQDWLRPLVLRARDSHCAPVRPEGEEQRRAPGQRVASRGLPWPLQVKCSYGANPRDFVCVFYVPSALLGALRDSKMYKTQTLL